MEYVVFSSSANLLTGCRTNIGGGTALPSNFKWTPPNEADLYTCKITGEHAQHWCENGCPDLCNC